MYNLLMEVFLLLLRVLLRVLPESSSFPELCGKLLKHGMSVSGVFMLSQTLHSLAGAAASNS